MDRGSTFWCQCGELLSIEQRLCAACASGMHRSPSQSSPSTYHLTQQSCLVYRPKRPITARRSLDNTSSTPLAQPKARSTHRPLSFSMLLSDAFSAEPEDEEVSLGSSFLPPSLYRPPRPRSQARNASRRTSTTASSDSGLSQAVSRSSSTSTPSPLSSVFCSTPDLGRQEVLYAPMSAGFARLKRHAVGDADVFSRTRSSAELYGSMFRGDSNRF